MTTIDARLLEAHAADDKQALAALYQEAASIAETPDAEAFFLTHAYVFALEAGLPLADQLRTRLVTLGREPAAE